MSPRALLSFGNFLSGGHFFLIIYIIGPYLATFMSDDAAGLVISLGAVVTLAVFPWMPSLVRRFGSRNIALALAFLQAVMLLLLAANPIPVFAAGLLALVCATAPFIAYQLDLLLEATVREEGSTGRIRTAFLTASSVAVILAPLLIGAILGDGSDYRGVFLAASLSLTPFIMLFLFERPQEGAPPRISRLSATCICIMNDKDLRSVTFAHAMLQVFYNLAPLYIPLYLHTVLGMPWSDLGWLLAFALLPFVFLEYPAGWIADRFIGDKEMLVAGFLIMGGAFALVPLITLATPLAAVFGILLLTRVGAAITEAMVEGHFFRRVDERDASTVSVIRMMRPAGALVAPLVGSILLATTGYGTLFISTGIAIALLGTWAALGMQDIR
ncbi:MAG TPA: MFS transporter [Candidatus Paceibacterota bacterium]|nr:MFS transporter [Candidatus Paceibacterota bacterium]